MTNLYLWCKSLHILSVILWMSGMIAVPWVAKRVAAIPPPRNDHTQEVLRILRQYEMRCTSPAMALAWCLGLYMAKEAHYFTSGWMHMKLAFALVLSGVHGYFARVLRLMSRNPSMELPRSFKWVHRGVVLAALVVVSLVIHKPGFR